MVLCVVSWKVVLHLLRSSSLSDPLLTSLRLGVANLEELLEPKKLRISIFSTGTKTLNFEIL